MNDRCGLGGIGDRFDPYKKTISLESLGFLMRFIDIEIFSLSLMGRNLDAYVSYTNQGNTTLMCPN